MIMRRMFDLPTWGRTNPFQELELMRNRMERLFQGVEGGPSRRSLAGVFPLINLTEDKEHYYIRAELPGIKADDLDIQATGKNISISGERKIASEGEEVKYHRREREAGRFSRIINLPGEVDSGKVTANMKNGVLTITVPKAEAAKPRQITVS